MSEYKEQAKAAILLSRMPTVGAATFKRLIAEYGEPVLALKNFQRQDATELIKLSSHSKRKRNDEALLQRALAFIESPPKGYGITYFGASDYPKRLAETSEPSPVLFYRGSISICDSRKTVAIVGARKASLEALDASKMAAELFVRNGFTVVSGGALGVDTMAHETVLSLKGKTIAALGCGIEIAYPPENEGLFKTIAQNGVLLTEFFPHTPPTAGHFPTRNRIIAALSDAVVFIEGSGKSGGLITVKRGLEFGKKLLYYHPKNGNISEGTAFIERVYSKAISFADSIDLVDKIAII